MLRPAAAQLQDPAAALLREAASLGDTQRVVNMIVEGHVRKVDAPNEAGWTALHLAAVSSPHSASAGCPCTGCARPDLVVGCAVRRASRDRGGTARGRCKRASNGQPGPQRASLCSIVPERAVHT
jgi:hypothetical protein